jgi:hypothetical protein
MQHGDHPFETAGRQKGPTDEASEFRFPSLTNLAGRPEPFLRQKLKMLNLCFGCARLSLAEESDTFPRMNYRRKKVSLKQRLEEAIEEISDEPLQGSGFEREMPEEGFRKIEPGTPELRQPHAHANVKTQYRHL